MSRRSLVLETARIQFEDGTPLNLDSNDFYYSRHGGEQESEYVCIEANQLPAHWQEFDDSGEIRYSIFETGFGTGLNFLTTADRWLKFLPQANSLNQLHYYSVEKQPLKKSDLIRVMQTWSKTFSLADELIKHYPPAISAHHQLAFESITLNLILLPLDQALASIEPKDKRFIDCVYLDGFAPDKNPSIWQAKLIRRLSHFCKPNCRLSTYTAASKVRKLLIQCGFTIKKIKGYANKREMLSGCFDQQPHSSYKSKHPWYEFNAAERNFDPVIIIGAGVAGCATAQALAKQKINSIVIDQHDRASGTMNDFMAAIYSPYLSADFNLVSQFYWAAYQLLRQFLIQYPEIRSEHCGTVDLADDAQSKSHLHSIFKNLSPSGMPLQWLSDQQTSAVTGLNCNFPGLFNQASGWLNPQGFCQKLLDSQYITTKFKQKVTELRHVGSTWQIKTGEAQYSAHKVILCTGADSNLVAGFHPYGFDWAEGDISKLNYVSNTQPIKTIIRNQGYLIPDNQSNQLQYAGKFNQGKLVTGHWLNGIIEPLHASQSVSKIGGTRLTSKDHLPHIGPAPAYDYYQRRFPEYIKTGRLKNCPEAKYVDGLFFNTAHGFRGVTASLLSAEIIAALITGHTLPVPTKLYHAVHPARFLVKSMQT